MHRGRLLALLVVAGGIVLVAAPEAALAHGLVGREDLPIPKWLFGWAAAVVLVASFVALAVVWPKPRLEQPAERRVAGVPRLLDPLAGAIGVALFGLVVYAGFAGDQTTTNNLAPTFIFVLFWVGLAVVSPIFGDVFKALNPWRASRTSRQAGRRSTSPSASSARAWQRRQTSTTSRQWAINA